MAKIFISYSRDSQDVVEELVQDLNDDGHETWFDQRLTGSQQWWDMILSEIRKCDIFVAALTPDSLESLACQRELKYADLLQKPLCPVLLDDEVRPEVLPHRLAELQWVDYCHRDKLAFKNLQRTIRGLPKAPPLPDPLPDPPAVPRSYLSTLRERIEIDSPLEFKDQAQLVFELRGSFRDGGAAKEITDLLRRLKRRDELFAKVARDIDELLGDINRGQRGSLSSKQHEPLRGSTSLVEAAPKLVMEDATKEEAEKIKAALEKAGAKVELKSNGTPQEVRENQVRGAGLDNNGVTASRTVNGELVMAVATELGSMDRTWYTPDIPVDKANNAR